MTVNGHQIRENAMKFPMTNPLHQAPDPYIKPKCHHLEPQITEEVDSYFIKNWGFSNERAIQKFRAAGFSRVTCCYYPDALDDRIHFGCRLLTLLFLIDGKYRQNKG